MAIPSDTEIQQLVSQVATGKTWGELKAQFDAWVADDPLCAAPIIAALQEEGDPKNSGARANMAGHVVSRLTLHPQRPVGIAELIRSVNLSPRIFNGLMTNVGQMPVDVIDGVLGGLDPTAPAEVRFGFALGQERLVRHHTIGEAGQRLHSEARALGLEAAWLPATLHRWEADLRCFLPFAGPHRTERPAQTLETEAPIADSSTLGSLLSEGELSVAMWPAPTQCRAAHERMVLQSNGKIETVAFDQGSTGEHTAWEEKILEPDATATKLPTWAMLQYFFSTAQSPGAYTKTQPVWRSRHDMGRALIGWVQAHPMQAFHDAIDACDNYEWFRVDATGPWFYDVAWDSAILCLGADRGTLLIATDTD